MKKTQAILVLCLIFLLSVGVGVGAVLGFSKFGANQPEVLIANNQSSSTKNDKIDTGKKTVTPPGYDAPITQDKSTETPIVVSPSTNDGAVVEQPKQWDAPAQKSEPTPPVSNDQIFVEESVGDKIVVPTTIKIGKDITLTSENSPVPNPDTQTYTYSVTATGGLGDLTYHLYASKNAKDTISNRTGRFVNIPYVSGGKYTLLVVDATGNAFKKEVSGFTTINKQLSTTELSRRLSKSTPDRSMGIYFANGYKMSFTGLNSGDPKPTNYTSIYSNIASGYWKSVKVTSVEYNDYNKITKITIHVTYNY